MKGFDTSIWFAFLVPAQTPKGIVDKLNAEIGRVLRTKDAREYLIGTGVEVTPGTPSELARFIRSETDKYRKIIQASGFQSLVSKLTEKQEQGLEADRERLAPGAGDGLADVAALELGQLLDVFLDQVRELLQRSSALGRRPRGEALRVVEGPLRGGDRAVDVPGPPRGARASSSPLAGSITSKVCPSAASTRSPPMTIFASPSAGVLGWVSCSVAIGSVSWVRSQTDASAAFGCRDGTPPGAGPA